MARNALPYRVECKPFNQTFFEPIAAFDCERAAKAYAGECYAAHAINAWHYRVVARGKVLELLTPANVRLICQRS